MRNNTRPHEVGDSHSSNSIRRNRRFLGGVTGMQLTLFDDIFDPPGIEDQMIEKALLRGSGFAGGKARIWQFAQTHPSNGELANFLRNEYGIGGWGCFTEGMVCEL